MKKCFLLLLLLVPFVHSQAEWQQYRGVTVWAKYASSKRTFTWSAGTDAHGYAHGYGTYSVFFDGRLVATYVGTMEHGRMEGKVSASYLKTGQKFDGQIRNWDENGFGTMTYPDGRVEAGSWVDGKLVAPAGNAPVIADGPTGAAPPEQPLGEVVELSGRLGLPGQDASPAERFLHELSVITRFYMLDTAYQTAVGDSLQDDAHRISGRAAAVSRLLRASHGIPLGLRKSVEDALLLDVMLIKTAAYEKNATKQGFDDLEEWGRKLPGAFSQRSNDEAAGGAFGLMLRSASRIEVTKAMFNLFLQTKQQTDLHRVWSATLASLTAVDPGLRRFAAVPAVTDPSWHFLRSKQGDIFVGQSISSRGGGRRAPVLASPEIVHLGDLSRGPVVIRLRSKGPFAMRLMYSLPRGARPVFAMKCDKGHFGLLASGDESAWVARGLADAKDQGRLDFSQFPYYFNDEDAKTYLFHLPTLGASEDHLAEGYLLIYIARQFPSDASALAEARQID